LNELLEDHIAALYRTIWKNRGENEGGKKTRNGGKTKSRLDPLDLPAAAARCRLPPAASALRCIRQ
jgi:hypothetical protein